MATQTLPHVVRFPQSVRVVEPISQTELGLVLSLRDRLKRLEIDLAAAEDSIKARLEAGAEVEVGDRVAELRESFRRAVSWKAVVFRLATRLRYDGERYCNRVLASTKPTRTVSLESSNPKRRRDLPGRAGVIQTCVWRNPRWRNYS